MSTFSYMLLAHLLYDFHWQGPFISAEKGKRPFLLAVHSATWAFLLCAVIAVTSSLAWWHWPLLYATHYIVDFWKSQQPKTDETFWMIYVDQALHLVSIVIVALSL